MKLVDMIKKPIGWGMTGLTGSVALLTGCENVNHAANHPATQDLALHVVREVISSQINPSSHKQSQEDYVRIINLDTGNIEIDFPYEGSSSAISEYLFAKFNSRHYSEQGYLLVFVKDNEVENHATAIRKNRDIIIE